MVAKAKASAAKPEPPAPKASAISQVLDLQDSLADEARSLGGPNADAVRHAVMAVVKDIGSVANAIDTNKRLTR